MYCMFLRRPSGNTGVRLIRSEILINTPKNGVAGRYQINISFSICGKFNRETVKCKGDTLSPRVSSYCVVAVVELNLPLLISGLNMPNGFILYLLRPNIYTFIYALKDTRYGYNRINRNIISNRKIY